ncbi:hypothetical protein [Sphingomonas sp. UYP23]
MISDAVLLTITPSLPGLVGSLLPAALLAAGVLLSSALQSDAQATEALQAGAFVNIFSSGGSLRVRNAIATDPSKSANGFVLAPFASGQVAVVSMLGINSAITVDASAIAGVWLSETVPGGFTTTQPTTPGHIVQSLGQAMPGLGIFFGINPAYVQ